MITKDQAQLVASWWAKHLKGDPLMNNGEPSQVFMMQMLAKGRNDDLSDQQIQKFEKALAQLIVDAQPPVISVDYHPCKILADAGFVAGIDVDNRLPIKSVTSFHSMSYRLGYDSPWTPFEDSTASD